MRKRILSLCLSAVILMGAGAVCGTAARATETAGEGATNTETAQIQEETAADQVPTDAAGNVITPETAKAIQNRTWKLPMYLYRRMPMVGAKALPRLLLRP